MNGMSSTGTMRETLLAGIEIPRPENAEPGGLDYYDGPVFETLRLEQFSHAALVYLTSERKASCLRARKKVTA